jgi:O-antigen/teichoic acid export membrane protein
MYAASGPLIRTLLGPAWMPAEAVFKALVVLGLIQCLGNPLDSLMLALGRAKLSFWFNVLALCLYAAAIPMGARFGLIGVAWAMVLACGGVMVPADLWLRWAVARMTPGEYAKAWLPFLGMGLIAAGLVSVLARFLGGWPDAAALAVLAAAGACAFLAMASFWSRSFLERVARLIAGGA